MKRELTEMILAAEDLLKGLGNLLPRVKVIRQRLISDASLEVRKTVAILKSLLEKEGKE